MKKLFCATLLLAAGIAGAALGVARHAHADTVVMTPIQAAEYVAGVAVKDVANTMVLICAAIIVIIAAFVALRPRRRIVAGRLNVRSTAGSDFWSDSGELPRRPSPPDPPD